MDKNKELLQESLNRIKNMMYYDSEMTAIENEEIIEEQLGALAAKPVVDMYRQQKGIPVRPQEVVRVTRILHKNLNNSGNSRRVFRSVKNSLYQIQTLVGRKIHQTDEDAIEAIKNEYERLYGDNLISDVQNKLTNLNYKGLGKQKELLSLLQSDGVTNTTSEPQVAPATSSNKTQYPPCQGGVNKLGCKSNSIVLVQDMLKGVKVDGMFGPKTQERLSRVAPEFSEQFMDGDVSEIREKLKLDAEHGVTHPVPGESQPISKIASKKVGGLDMSNVTKSPTGELAVASKSKIKPDEVTRGQQRRDDRQARKATAQTNRAEVAEDGYTNMAMGFVNESTMSPEEIKRRNKKDRLDKKLGRV